MNLIQNGSLDLEHLSKLSKKPPLYSKSEQKFWDDPYIAKQMMRAHLNPTHDAASRKPETIQEIVDWIRDEFLHPVSNKKLIDLGCGPGLYASRFAKAGLSVTGIDISENSIQYAKKTAMDENLQINYQLGNYLQLQAYEQFDAATLIYFDYGTFIPADRQKILANVAKALKTNGLFIFDVMTQNNPFINESEEWHAAPGGFWSPNPYVCLTKNYLYPETNAMLSQHIVLENNGEVKLYRIWEHWFDIDQITRELDRYNFELIWIGSDLTGKAYEKNDISLGIVARKK